MRIVVVHPEQSSRERWAAALAQRLAQAKVLCWDAAQGAGAAPEAGKARLVGDEPATGATASTGTSSPGGTGGSPAGRDPVETFDFAVGWNPPADFFDRARVLRAFFSTGAGVDHLLRHPGLPASLQVIRLENAGMGLQMAEYCCHEVLRVFRRQSGYEQQQRDRIWREIAAPPRESFVVGILGLGVLGEQVARMLGLFGFPVAGYSRTPRAVDGVECFSGADGLPRFLARCSVLVVLAPLTPQTEGLLDRQRLAMLPRGAALINVARGGLVVDSDLIEALDAGHLTSATLDVFRVEPLPAEHAFWGHPKIRMTPHVSAMTLVDESATQIAGKIRAIEAAQAVGGVVDRARGY